MLEFKLKLIERKGPMTPPPKRLFFIVNFACQEFQVQTFVKSPFSPAAPPPLKLMVRGPVLVHVLH